MMMRYSSYNEQDSLDESHRRGVAVASIVRGAPALAEEVDA